MRNLALCALTAVTFLTSTDAEAGRRRRCHYQHTQHTTCGHSVSYGTWNGNACGVSGACGTVNSATTNYAPVEAAACAPAQPVTYSAGYAPMSNQAVSPTTPVAPPPPQATTQPLDGQLQAPPAPQAVEPQN